MKQDKAEWFQMGHWGGGAVFTSKGQGQIEQEQVCKTLQGRRWRVKILKDKSVESREQWQETESKESEAR